MRTERLAEEVAQYALSGEIPFCLRPDEDILAE
jgi:hypothetical protein